MPPVPPAFCVANRVAVYSQRDGLQPGSDWPELCSANHRFSDWRIWLPRGATKWQGYQLLPWLLGLYALSVIATRGAGLLNNASLVEILIPFCVMAIANGAIYPIVVAQALRPFPQATGRAAALQNTLQLGLCFWQAGGFMAHQHAAADHHQRNALYRCSGGVRLQNAVSCRLR